MSWFGLSKKAPDRSAAGPAEPQRPAEEYRAAPSMALPMGRELVLTGSPPTLVPVSTFDLLSRCRSFQTLEGHAESLAHDLGLSAPGAVRDELLEFVRAGLLVSKSSLWTAATSPGGDAAHRISTLAVPTANREVELRRCIQSHHQHCAEHGRTVRFLVADDARAPDDQARCRQVASDLGATTGSDIAYVGEPQKRQLITQLAQQGFPEGILRFAFLGTEGATRTAGANHNTIFMHTLDESVLCVDDDVALPASAPPEVASGLSLDSAHDPTSFWWFRSRPEATRDRDHAGIDLLAHHEQLLGQSLSACIAAVEDESALDLKGLGDGMLAALLAGSGSVAVTSAGLAGDCGMGSTRYYLALRGESRERLVQSAADYALSSTSRAIQRAVTRPTISEGTFLMSYGMAVANHTLLPPFFPVLRNSDGLFGALLRVICPHRYIGHLPVLVQHLPHEARSSSAEANLLAGINARANDLFLSILGLFEGAFGLEDTEARMRAVGHHILGVASLGRQSFAELLTFLFRTGLSRQIADLEHSLTLYEEEPDYWASDVRKTIAAYIEAASRDEGVAPVDLPASWTPEERRANFRDMLASFGELLILWPDIVRGGRQSHPLPVAAHT